MMAEQPPDPINTHNDGTLSPELLDAALDVWKQTGRTHYIPIRGRSMWPLLREGQYALVSHTTTEMRCGDIIVFRQGRDMIAHRLLRVVHEKQDTHYSSVNRELMNGRDATCRVSTQYPSIELPLTRHYVTGGDNSTQFDPPVQPAQIVGRVIGLRTDERYISLDTPAWRWTGFGIAIASRVVKRLASWYRTGRASVAGRAGAVPLEAHMSPDDRLLLACTRQTFSREYQERVYQLCGDGSISWAGVYETAVKHGVAPLVYTNLSVLEPARLDMPAEVREKFRLFRFRTALQYEQQTRTLAGLLQTLASYDVDVMYIKGAALSRQVYAQPWYTISEDTDLVLHARTAPSSVTCTAVADLLNPHAIEWEWETHHDVTLNAILSVDFEDIWRTAIRIDVGGQPAYVMSPEYMLITACLNSCRKRFFRLKTLSDIAEIVAAFPDIDWQRIVQLARRYECSAILYTALHVTRTLLDCPIPAHAFADLAVHPARVALIHRLTQHLLSKPLDSLYVFADIDDLHKRRFSASLALPYASYTWAQAWHKLHEAFTDWRTG